VRPGDDAGRLCQVGVDIRRGDIADPIALAPAVEGIDRSIMETGDPVTGIEVAGRPDAACGDLEADRPPSSGRPGSRLKIPTTRLAQRSWLHSVPPMVSCGTTCIRPYPTAARTSDSAGPAPPSTTSTNPPPSRQNSARSSPPSRRAGPAGSHLSRPASQPPSSKPAIGSFPGPGSARIRIRSRRSSAFSGCRRARPASLKSVLTSRTSRNEIFQKQQF